MEQKFEDKNKALEAIVEKLENGEVGLDESIEEYTKAMNLVKECDEKLKNIDANKYDYIVIAIFSAAIVLSVIDLLKRLNIDEKKILFIKKNSITSDLLPDEVRDSFLKL